MEKVNGIGGFFFRAQDPENLKQWYIDHLGLDITDMVWSQAEGPTVFEPFKSDSDYFNEEKKWMLNFRVSNLKKMIQELKSKGVEVIEKDEWNSMPEVGIFARIHDPENNPIELWQPAKT